MASTVLRGATTDTLRVRFEVFQISFLILFLELACIRWFGSTVIFLTFFTNIVLMASFLGVSVGCLAAGRRTSFIAACVPLVLVAVASASVVLWVYQWSSRVMIDVGGQQSPQLIYFGTDARLKDASKFVVPIEALAGVFFVLIALLFVGPGQELGRRFRSAANPIGVYTADILGSLAGIAAFGVVSFLWLPAVVWFTAALTLALFVHREHLRRNVTCGLLAIAVVGLADWPRDLQGVATDVSWSPYYQVKYKPLYKSIDVNNMGHQGMVPVGRAGPAYMLPHLLQRDAGGRAFGDVLVVGAGSGNDVAAALRSGSASVDAVEIDPVISLKGRLDHPDRPYSDPRVSLHLDDGRSYLRKTSRKYDLVVYALVDSLALHSSYSSLRLESFLFTEEAFRDIRATLTPDGVFVMYNFYRQGWVVGRLALLAERVFHSKPLVISMPYQDVIGPTNDQRDHITFLIVGNDGSSVVEVIRSQFDRHESFWIADQPVVNERMNGFGATRPAATPNVNFSRIAPARVDVAANEPLPRDDWPFLYLRNRSIPALNIRGMAILVALSLIVLFAFAPSRSVRPNPRMFFLGAGFMLLEARGVVQMALLFGATWVVNSIVFFAILVMILLSNAYVVGWKPVRLGPYFALLVTILAATTVVPLSGFLALPHTAKLIASCCLVYAPIFFAGAIFAVAFRDSVSPDVDLGSNIGGIILGGLSENLSVVLGFNHLLWIAIAFYLLAWGLGPVRTPTIVQA
jgi:SAM-dependent methyltransferase